MKKSAFYSLLTGSLYEKKETKKLTKIPVSYENRFYKTLNDPFDKIFDTLFQRDAIKNALSKDVP